MTEDIPPASPRHDSGFTLVEVLVGLALLALMTALLTGALSGVRQAQRSHDSRTLKASVEPVETYLRRLLIDMRPIRPSITTGSALIDARDNALTLTSGYGPPGGYGGLHRVTLSLNETGRTGLFDLEETRTLHRPTREGEAETRTRLLGAVAGLKLRYLGPLRPGTPPVWSETWTSPTQLPHAVSIDITFPAGDPRRWTQLIIAVPAAR